ncbi:MAG: purine-nucleoside phosphorylase [Eggerthellaceae bacterium]|nr:purine-nucleoside phosphorylase [Eggerthellaceae bacterium]
MSAVEAMPNQLIANLDEAASFMRERLGQRQLDAGIILGSGLGTVAEGVEDALIVPYGEVPHMNRSTVIGHAGQFVVGIYGGKQVICMQGRLHGYEGNAPQEVAFPVWLMHRLGANTLIASNAAGAINESYNVGDLCLMTDHINFTGRNPIVGQGPNEIAPRFFSMLNCYDPELRALAHRIADERGVSVQEGVYLGLKGPSFETAAEIRAFRAWGADTVAMSVVEEVIAARHVGMRVLGISLVSNMACGVGDADPCNDEVFETAFRAAGGFAQVVEGVLEELPPYRG